ncbi:ATP-binding protein [Skermanella stibiiresistens]|uniref:ATP-binding protein n=1 Tax=Skermanella stibiiresistens TaxID=913326 RepID=UPI0004BA174D|nr:ATP-binding protein [Skermanella stibiiresistens]
MCPRALYGVGVTVRQLEEIAALGGRAGCPVVVGLPGDGDPPLGGAAVIAVGLDQESLQEIVRRGAGACVELGGLDPSDVADTVRRAQACTLLLSLTTATAYQLPVAYTVVEAVDRAVPQSRERRDDMELALQEAVSNAVIHGNLAVSSLRDPTLAALNAFSAQVSERLADPALANLRIQVAVTIRDEDITIDVTDQGSGFVPKPKAAATASGRGIGLIGTLCAAWQLLDDGRRIHMRFAR